jgi:hypothetical protein
VGSSDERLWDEVSGMLQPRPGWTVQDSPTPGGNPNWSFAPHGKVLFSVYADGGILYLYEEKTDSEVRFDSVENLKAALEAIPATALPDGPATRRPFLSWN